MDVSARAETETRMRVRSRLAHDMSHVQLQVVHLAETVDRTLVDAMWALTHHHQTLALHVVDMAVDMCERLRAIDAAVSQLLASRQPLLASDLRVIHVLTYTAYTLARIGKETHSIAMLIARSNEPPLTSIPLTLPQMAQQARTMLQQAIRAIVTRDTKCRTQLQQQHDALVHQHQTVVQQSFAVGDTQPAQRAWTIAYVLIAHHLAQIAASTVTIADHIGFISTGTMSTTWS